jgi:hypothetical protein
VALVMALALMGLWLRSLSVSDRVIVVAGPRLHAACLSDGAVVWVGRHSQPSERTQWLSGPVGSFDVHEFDDLATFGYILALPLTVLLFTFVAGCLILVPGRKRVPIASQPDA